MTMQNTPTLPIEDLLEQGGPIQKHYDAYNHLIDQLAIDLEKGSLSQEELLKMQDVMPEDLKNETLHGHSLHKPYGYAGDFMIIDMIYRNQIHPKYSNWDTFYQQVGAPQAVRNRKDYFKKMLSEKLQNGEHFELMNIASGPARDLKEVFEETNCKNLTVDCVEYDQKAIDFAKEITAPYADQITFNQANIFRFQTKKKYDLVWSAGLFDYFNDKTFSRVLAKLLTWVKPGGELVIGNFDTTNPSKNFMEVMLDWYLHHRTPEEMKQLAIEAGAPENSITIGKEPLGINLFMHIQL